MDLGSAVRVLLRRWLVVLIGAVMTIGAAGYFYSTAETQYQATARMLLLLPADARGPENRGSPFLYLPNGLNVIARIVSGEPLTRDYRMAMADEGLSSSYTVGVDPHTPIITVSVEGTDPADVIATRDWLVDSLNESLHTLQVEEGAPSYQIAHTRVYEAEDVPLAMGGDWKRSVLAAGAAGVLVTVLAAFAVDRLLILRNARRTRRMAQASVASAPTESADKASQSSETDEPEPVAAGSEST